MTIPDDTPNPKAAKKAAKPVDPITAIREAMERQLADMQSVSAVPMPELRPKVQESIKVNTGAIAKPQCKANFQEDVVLPDPAEWPQIIMKIALRSQQLISEYMERNKGKSFEWPAPDTAHISEAFAELLSRVLNDPQRFVYAQIALWQGYLKIWQSAVTRMQGQPAEEVISPPTSDRRFQDEEWRSNWLFDYLKQTYLFLSQWSQAFVSEETKSLDPKLAHKLNFYTRQMIDAISPSNFWMTNPEVLRITIRSGGENLVKGLENMLEDLERGQGTLRIRMSDTSAFKVGSNLATTQGKVIFQNRLIQLIQYEPLTETVHKTPLLIIPPWINKFYILDLGEKKSFIRNLVSQGHTVFCISWVNPDETFANTNFDDYMVDGTLAVLREIKKVTGEDAVNVLGYCIGGTLLACALAYLKAKPEAELNLPKVASATYLVTMVDFREPGDLGVFIDEDQITALEQRMAKQGYLDAASMAATFNMLRANDLIWSFVVNNYLLAREPFPFDILFWNMDSTNLPAAMHGFYLREMYLNNKLVEPNGLKMKGVPIDIRKITTPSFLLSTSEDHIAPWRSTYAATQLYNAPITFVLSGSGHIAGVVNPPATNKYGYWTNDKLPADPEDWLKSANKHAGSWWPHWIEWLAPFAGEDVPARQVSDGIESAPGSYVKG